MDFNKTPDYKNLKVLFVCLGNTCRSPMAESVLKHFVENNNELNWEIDSAGLRDWNIECPPEERCLKILYEHGLSSNHVGRELEEGDFNKYDFIFGMDGTNINELERLAPENSKAKIVLLGNYSDPDNPIINDPYWTTGDAAFRECYNQIHLGCKNFINWIIRNSV